MASPSQPSLVEVVYKYPLINNIINAINDEKTVPKPVHNSPLLPPLFSSLPSCIDDPSFVIYFLPAREFMDLNGIARHEDIKTKLLPLTAHQLKTTHKEIAKKTIFISHRWVNNCPDSSDNFQFNYIVSALQKFQERSRNSMFIWIDYSCMHQDTPDLETIKRLNYILSFCEYFMICLPLYDSEGLGYIKRVWCVYEWLAVLHFKRILILPSSSFANQIMANSLNILEDVLNPNVFLLLESIRTQYWNNATSSDYNITLLFNIIQQVFVDDAIFDEVGFINKLEAFDNKDKAYVYKNISSIFSLLDCLFIIICGISNKMSNLPSNSSSSSSSNSSSSSSSSRGLLRSMYSVPSINIDECTDNSITIVDFLSPMTSYQNLGKSNMNGGSDDSSTSSLGWLDSSDTESSLNDDSDDAKGGDGVPEGNVDGIAALRGALESIVVGDDIFIKTEGDEDDDDGDFDDDNDD